MNTRVSVFNKMLHSVAAVGIAACMFKTASLWLCGGNAAYVLNVRNTAITMQVTLLSTLETGCHVQHNTHAFVFSGLPVTGFPVSTCIFQA